MNHLLLKNIFAYYRKIALCTMPMEDEKNKILMNKRCMNGRKDEKNKEKNIKYFSV